jgi:hypothetical protein
MSKSKVAQREPTLLASLHVAIWSITPIAKQLLLQVLAARRP